MMESHFRSEIAGLRAIAVLSVTLFHLKVSGFSGGFVGVDVFFVISGYLISRNILFELKTGRFSLAQFYVRRTRRIYPALIFTVVATYIAGALWCSPLMFLDLAKECTHALLSIANIQYWRESHKYFAANSDELALLHFWSLSLEEQFYLVWPLLLLVATRFKRTFVAISLAGGASLLGAIAIARSDALAAFFLMPFRISEFAVGAMVLFFERRFSLTAAAAEGLSAGGIVCIVASVFLVDSNMPHLETAMLLPCIGAAATIWAGSGARAAKIITAPPMLGIGAISYSLYLCHWPIIFFARFIFGEAANSIEATTAMMILMVVVATGMYWGVERKFILPSRAPVPTVLKNTIAFGVVIFPLVAITHTTFLSRGLAWRLPQEQFELVHLQGFPTDADLAGTVGPIGVQFAGDSLMIQYEYGLKPVMKSLGISFEALGGAGCPILYGALLSKSTRRDECIRARDKTLDKLASSTSPLIFGQLWNYYDDATIDYDLAGGAGIPSVAGSFKKLQAALDVTIGKLVGQGHRILLVGTQLDPGCPVNLPRLEQGPLPHAPLSCPPTSLDEAKRFVAPVDRMLADIQAKWSSQVKLIRPVDYFCDRDCPVVKEGVWLYTNRTHLSLAGANYMISRSGEVFRDFLAAGR
jgi:peptidoglycan/LPS O-acetylase OafA/YrhL